MREISIIENNKRKIIKKPELLAPAGSLEKLKFAVLYGADAVFIGGKEFSLRARASNFSLDDIKEAVDFAKDHGSKVYVTTNIIPHNENLENLETYLKGLYEAGVAAIICADPYIVSTARRVVPNLELHLSTQQSITNSKGIEFWLNNGVSRVVLARELTMDEIKDVSDNTEGDLEVFIHGGMCVSYSGRCTLSNNMTDRDANRGGCAHSCRWNYSLYSKSGGNDHLLSDETIPFSMSSKDLMAVNHIPGLIECGVDSLKIEGRMKSIHYIATVVGTYRKLIDDYCENPDDFELTDYYLQEIAKAENRLTAEGFLSGEPSVNEQLYNMRSEQPTQEFIGIVRDYDEETGYVTVEQRNKFIPGEEIEFNAPGMVKYNLIVDKIFDEEFNELDAARHPRQILKLKVPFKLRPYTIVRRKR
ncbi:peptidase U32 family protein [Haloplasma contractile]|uniref:Peptidase U32 family protein n=1 Tax=Haloplasma contractile SSD-17B TaxID=1033810 RepID=U2FRX3_9MOLU|nr:U32 family peptidase [Haloplasma contractile]ERJ13719.1 Peptidase U32 family protein [Haloplasma contractile SSD-17B]